MFELECASFKTMGCPCQIRLFGTSKTHVRRVIKKAIKELKRLNDKYTRYTSSSLTSQINAAAGTQQFIHVDTETAAILNYAATCYEQSSGLFDITSGVLRRVWDFSKNELPTQESIDKTLSIIGWNKVEWKPPRISLPKVGMELDFGGVVKEYAADAVYTLCHKAGIHHGIIELGGDIRVIGPTPDNEPWSITIQHPRDPEKGLVKIKLYRGGMSTSGDYERYMVVNGKRYYHILNPKTGWPVESFSSVTVLADYCVIAGSASTIAMLKGKQAIAWLDNLTLPYWCSDETGHISHQKEHNEIKTY